MRLDLYLQETRQLTEKNTALLDEVRLRLEKGSPISNLEQAGVLHALQLLIENAIGKAKHTLKHLDKTIPVSAYDSFATLCETSLINEKDLVQWNAIIGLRNKIVHDYMNIDPAKIYQFIANREYERITRFLLTPIK